MHSFVRGGTSMHKKTAKKGLDLEMVRDNVERMEQERIDYERRARLVRGNLYGTAEPRDMARGWVDHSRK